MKGVKYYGKIIIYLLVIKLVGKWKEMKINI